MITDYSKIVDLDNWPPKPEGEKQPESTTNPDVPDWAQPIVETITKTEQLIKDMADKKSTPEPLLGTPETENGISPAVQDYLNRNKR